MPLTWNTAGTESEAPDYRVEISFVPVDDFRRAGYHNPAGEWHMQFRRGCYMAGAYHGSLSEAQCNAERIVNYMRGTHDVFGQPLRKRARA